MIDNKARNDFMQEILDKTIKGLLQKLTQEPCELCGSKRCSTQDYANIMKFLKDNGFKVDPAKAGDALDAVLAEMNKAKAVYPDLPS